MITSLNHNCDEMRKHIGRAKQDTTPVLEEATTLTNQKKESETKQQLLNAFTQHFVIPDEDLLSLTSAEVPIDAHFFDVLARVKQVHHDCEVLLGGENERLGLELMEKSARNLNSAYQKLYMWIQKEFRSLNLEDPRISSSIRRALRVLAERPSLFHSCLDFFAEARDYILSDAFHYALSDAVSGAGGDRSVKPIEFSAHDPMRYIGDMLAWVHSTAVSEREALEALFVADGEELAKGIQAGLSSEPWSRIDREGQEEAPTFDGRKALSELVNRDLTGVSRSLRQRVELVIQGHDDPVTCFKVVNLLSFYRSTFSKLVGSQSNLVELIQALETFTFRHFETLMREHATHLSNDHPALTPSKDLSAPQFLLDTLEGLTSLMKTHEVSFGADEPDTATTTTTTPDPSSENRFTPVLRVALDPFLNLAKSSSEEVDDTTARTIYRTNVLLTTRTAISAFPFASTTHLPPLTTALSSVRIDLLDIQCQFFLENSGLKVLLEALEPYSPSPTKPSTTITTTIDKKQQQQQQPDLASIPTLPAFHPQALIATSQQLDDFLPSALMDASENLKRVQSATFVKSVTEEAIEAFCRDFEFVEGMIIGADEARARVDIGGRDGDGGGGSDSESESGKEGEDEGKEGKAKGGSEEWSLRALFPRTTGEIRVLLS